jgi:hypothetical protein
MRSASIPERRVRAVEAWQRARGLMEVQGPATYEQVLSMPLFNSGYITYHGVPLPPSDNVEWLRAGITTIGDVWVDVTAGGCKGFSQRGHVLHPATELEMSIPVGWRMILQAGPQPLKKDEWMLWTEPNAARSDEHAATGIRDSAGRTLVLLLAQHGSDWHVAQYMLTCNGWVWSGHAWAAASDMCRATVEPFATHRGPRPDTIRLVGATCAKWSESLGRLKWTAAGAGYDCWVGSARRKHILTQWRATPAPGQLMPKAQRVRDAIGCHPQLTLGKVVDWIKTHVFDVDTSDFMHETAIGMLHVGVGYGCRAHRESRMCKSCWQERESIYHMMVECDAYAHLRQWATAAVRAVTGYTLEGKPLASLLVFGYDPDMLHHYTVGAIREVAMEAFRRARNANANVARPLPPTLNAASRLLERRIRHDWELVIGTPRGVPIYTTAATRRWHPDTYCPISKADFNAHWAPLARSTTADTLILALMQYRLAKPHTHHTRARPSAAPSVDRQAPLEPRPTGN